MPAEQYYILFTINTNWYCIGDGWTWSKQASKPSGKVVQYWKFRCAQPWKCSNKMVRRLRWLGECSLSTEQQPKDLCFFRNCQNVWCCQKRKIRGKMRSIHRWPSHFRCSFFWFDIKSWAISKANSRLAFGRLSLTKCTWAIGVQKVSRKNTDDKENKHKNIFINLCSMSHMQTQAVKCLDATGVWERCWQNACAIVKELDLCVGIYDMKKYIRA